MKSINTLLVALGCVLCIALFAERSTFGEAPHQDCCAQYEYLMQRIDEVKSPFVRPCVMCILDKSTTPYCKNLCRPTPYVSLGDILRKMEKS